MTAVTTVDISTDKKLCAYVKAQVLEHYSDMWGAEEPRVLLMKLPETRSFDAAHIGAMYTIQVCYRDDDEERYVYQAVTFPDPRMFGKTVEDRVAFIQDVVNDLIDTRMYASTGLYRLCHR